MSEEPTDRRADGAEIWQLAGAVEPEAKRWDDGQQQRQVERPTHARRRPKVGRPTEKSRTGSPFTTVGTREDAEAAWPGVLIEGDGAGSYSTGALADCQDLGVHSLEQGPFQNLTRFTEI